jgi:hypothetical protein
VYKDDRRVPDRLTSSLTGRGERPIRCSLPGTERRKIAGEAMLCHDVQGIGRHPSVCQVGQSATSVRFRWRRCRIRFPSSHHSALAERAMDMLLVRL